MASLAAKPALPELRLEPLRKTGGEGGIVDIARVDARHCRARVSQAPARGGIGLENIAVGIVNKNGVIDGLEERARPFQRRRSDWRRSLTWRSRLRGCRRHGENLRLVL